MIPLVDWRLALTLGVPALIAVLGLLIGHWLNSRRELKNRRREARLKGLELAFTRLANFNHREWTDVNQLEFENFVTEIQLYGTPEQIRMMTEIVNAFIRRDAQVSLDALLENLRDALRAELRLEKQIGPIWWYRFKIPQHSVTADSTSPEESGSQTSAARSQ